MKDQTSQVFLQRARVITMARRTAFICFIIALFYSMAAGVYSTQVIYKVKLNYAVILEQFGGKRQAITEVGWHYRLPFSPAWKKKCP